MRPRPCARAWRVVPPSALRSPRAPCRSRAARPCAGSTARAAHLPLEGLVSRPPSCRAHRGWAGAVGSTAWNPGGPRRSRRAALPAAARAGGGLPRGGACSASASLSYDRRGTIPPSIGVHNSFLFSPIYRVRWGYQRVSHCLLTESLPHLNTPTCMGSSPVTLAVEKNGTEAECITPHIPESVLSTPTILVGE
jgi:hypothetical protein